MKTFQDLQCETAKCLTTHPVFGIGSRVFCFIQGTYLVADLCGLNDPSLYYDHVLSQGECQDRYSSLFVDVPVL